MHPLGPRDRTLLSSLLEVAASGPQTEIMLLEEDLSVDDILTILAVRNEGEIAIFRHIHCGNSFITVRSVRHPRPRGNTG